MDMISSATGNTALSVPHQKQDGDGVRKPRPHQNEALECPRCHSTNTKFCYYNNNTMTQPRYLCKACRRFWTLGGSLRNVPVGGSSRKNKKNHALGSAGSSSSSSSSASSSSSRSNINVTRLMMMPMPTTTTVTDYPNVLPTFMSNGGSVAPPPLLDIPRGGFLDSRSNYCSNGIGMTAPFSAAALGVMLMKWAWDG